MCADGLSHTNHKWWKPYASYKMQGQTTLILCFYFIYSWHDHTINKGCIPHLFHYCSKTVRVCGLCRLPARWGRRLLHGVCSGWWQHHLLVYGCCTLYLWSAWTFMSNRALCLIFCGGALYWPLSRTLYTQFLLRDCRTINNYWSLWLMGSQQSFTLFHFFMFTYLALSTFITFLSSPSHFSLISFFDCCTTKWLSTHNLCTPINVMVHWDTRKMITGHWDMLISVTDHLDGNCHR